MDVETVCGVRSSSDSECSSVSPKPYTVRAETKTISIAAVSDQQLDAYCLIRNLWAMDDLPLSNYA